MIQTYYKYIRQSCFILPEDGFLCRHDDSKGALRFAPLRLSFTPLQKVCDQLLPEFSRNHFETVHIYYKHFEDVHANFWRRKFFFFLQNYGTFDFNNFEVSLQQRVASLCNQFLPGFSSNQFETSHRCYMHIELVHVTFHK